MPKQGINPYKGGPVPKNRIEWAIENTNSMKAAARELHIAFNTLKKYAKMYDIWAPNQGDRGNTKPKVDKMWNVQVHDIFAGEYPNYPHWKLQKKLLHEGYLEQSCNGCGYSLCRDSDLTSPLLLYFKDKDTSNMELSNLELLCYNCYFINNDGSKPGEVSADTQTDKIHKALKSIRVETLQKKLMKAFN
jgi:hypothetical protein